MDSAYCGGHLENHRIETTIMNKITLVLILLLIALIVGFATDSDKSDRRFYEESFSLTIKNLSDTDYPDNPDIGFRSKDYQTELFVGGQLDLVSQPFIWDFVFVTNESDTVSLSHIDISELIPTIPEYIKSDEDLSYISCINQEWNRNQVKFIQGEFYTTIPGNVRLDLARNCLNAYLWEVILYIEEDGKTLPYAHGWFDFPHEMYGQLFEEKNNIPFVKYEAPLEEWIDAERKKIDLSLLRNIQDDINIEWQDASDEMYPLKAARKKKFKEIITPTHFSTMRDLQTDATTLATFSPPGYYNREDPRKTELGRIQELHDVSLHRINSHTSQQELYELQLTFSYKDNDEETILIIGGIDLDEFPVLRETEVNQGWKNPMGIGNHSFYESYEKNLANQSAKSPYYALLLNDDHEWLDSHHVGIDGPIFHFSDDERTELHLWLLSFERHAIVGHYKMQIQ